MRNAGLRRQLERLEEVYGGGGGGPPCGECGGGGNPGGDDDASAIEYELTFPGDREDAVPDPVEEFCASCGRQLTWVLSFDDDERDTRRQRTRT
jgi:hypothetical protein